MAAKRLACCAPRSVRFRAKYVVRSRAVSSFWASAFSHSACMSPSWLRESGICEMACAFRMMYSHRARRRRAPGCSVEDPSARRGCFCRYAFQRLGREEKHLSVAFRAAHPQSLPFQSAQAFRRRGLAAFELEDAAAIVHAHRRHAAGPRAVVAAVFRDRGGAQQNGDALHAQLACQGGFVKAAGRPKSSCIVSGEMASR